MAATRGGGIGERRVFILHWSNLSAALQLVLIHAVDVLFSFHLVGGDGQTVSIVLGKGPAWPDATSMLFESPTRCALLT